MVAHTQFFKPLVLALALTSAGVVAAQNNVPAGLNENVRSVVERSKALQNDAQKLVGSDWLTRAQSIPDAAMQQAKAIQQEVRDRVPLVKHAEQTRPTESAYDTLIFVSYSLDDATLDDVLTAASGDARTAVVMRGIPDGMRLWDGVKRLQDMALTKDPVPNVMLEPTLFETYAVTAVPTIVVLSELPDDPVDLPANPLESPENDAQVSKAAQSYLAPAERTVLGRVQGLSSPIWLQRRLAAGDNGDFGIRGPVEDIAERDLIDVMKERVLQIDWDQKKEQTKERYWQGQKFIALPRARKAEVRYVDASVIATADIKTSQGDFVARAGDRVNPLATRPWTQAVVVFDPLDKKQMELLHARLPAIASTPGVANVMLIATRFDAEEGWDSYTAVTDAFDAPVYQLTPDVKERFHLRYTPSIITANDTHFIVTELAPGDASDNENTEAQFHEVDSRVATNH